MAFNPRKYPEISKKIEWDAHIEDQTRHRAVREALHLPEGAVVLAKVEPYAKLRQQEPGAYMVFQASHPPLKLEFNGELKIDRSTGVLYYIPTIWTGRSPPLKWARIRL